MSELEFEDTTNFENQMATHHMAQQAKKTFSFVDFLVKRKIVKNESQAQIFLIIVIAVFILLSIFLFITANVPPDIRTIPVVTY